MKLYWNWAFAWDARDVELPKGKVRLELRSAFAEKDCRQIDCFVLTTDAAYRPLMKDRPAHPTWKLLEELSRDREIRREPLARRASPPGVAEAWKPRTFREKGFLYLWNMSHTKWAGGAPDRVPVPYHVSDAHVREAFEKKYAGVRDVPIFSDPRIVPVFHGAGPYILSTDATAPAKREEAEGFVRWLEAHPDRPWGLMMN